MNTWIAVENSINASWCIETLVAFIAFKIEHTVSCKDLEGLACTSLPRGWCCEQRRRSVQRQPERRPTGRTALGNTYYIEPVPRVSKLCFSTSSITIASTPPSPHSHPRRSLTFHLSLTCSPSSARAPLRSSYLSPQSLLLLSLYSAVVQSNQVSSNAIRPSRLLRAIA